MSRKFKLYTPYQMSKMSERDLRHAYSELRSIANKRLQRMQSHNIGIRARSGYRFPTIAEIEQSSRFTVASQLADVSTWLRDERTTVKGERRFLESFSRAMDEKGFSSLVDTPDKIYETLQFLDEIRDTHKEVQLPPSDILDVLSEAERLNIPINMLRDNIELFVAHMDELESVKPTKGGRSFSKQRLNALIRKWQ